MENVGFWETYYVIISVVQKECFYDSKICIN